MKEGCHAYTTQQALGILREVTGRPDLFLAPDLHTPDWMPSELSTSLAATGRGFDAVAFETGNCDHQNDIELVDVDGVLGAKSRDDPHKREASADDDEPHYEDDGSNFTAFSHFIDIRKGPGLFDDYDGYSYRRGSASVEEHEDVGKWKDAFDIDHNAHQFGAALARAASNMMVDQALAFWLADEYVHAPGQPWYRPGQCSPALERYTHTALWGPGDPRDHRGGFEKFGSVEDECEARFPLSEGRVTLSGGLGYPYSVFAPVDNLALANWRGFEASGDHAALGRVMHGIQDASIPHHAAGTCGNYHRQYEQTIQDRIIEWSADTAVRDTVASLLGMWDREDPDPPTSIRVGDERLIPAENWEIDQLVTWVALHAYANYANVYHGFPDGFSFHEASARDLVTRALAMSAHVMRRAARHQGLLPPRRKIPIKEPGIVVGPEVGPVTDGGDPGAEGGRGLPEIHVPPTVLQPMATDRGPRGGVSVSDTGDGKADPPAGPGPRRRDHRTG